MELEQEFYPDQVVRLKNGDPTRHFVIQYCNVDYNPWGFEEWIYTTYDGKRFWQYELQEAYY